MTKAKKVLSLVLAVVMVAAMFAFSASAATQNATFTVSVDDNATVSQNDVITVTVNLTTDYYAGPTNVPVYYNPAVFQFVEGSVTGAKIFGEGAATDVQSYNDADTGCLRVAFIPNTADGTAAAKHLDGTLFTFRLKAIADGTSDIGLKKEDQKTATNIGGPLYCGAYGSSAITANPDTVGQTFTITNTSATVGVAAQPELAVIAGTTGVIDAEHKYVYGVTPGEAATLYFEATNGGSINMLPNEAENCDYGTGATLQLLDVDGTTVLDTYTLIIFGDVSGDGAISSSDYTAMIRSTQGYALSDVATVAGDVDAATDIANPSVTSGDYTAVIRATQGFDLTVNPYAS